MELLRDPDFTTDHVEANMVYVGVTRGRNWTVRQYDAIIRELDLRLKTTVRELFEVQERSYEAERVPSLVMRFIAEVQSTRERPAFSNGVFEACCILKELIEVQRMRRGALLRYIDEATHWSVTELTLEIRRRERDLERAIELEIPPSETHALALVCREELYFAKDVIAELLPVLEKVKAMPNKKPQAGEIKEKARAKAEMKAQMTRERDDLTAKYPEQEQEINRVYRKMFDELEESA